MYLKFGHLKKFGQIFFGQTDRQIDKQTDKQIDRQTDKQIDRQTDIVAHREVVLPKIR